MALLLLHILILSHFGRLYYFRLFFFRRFHCEMVYFFSSFASLFLEVSSIGLIIADSCIYLLAANMTFLTQRDIQPFLRPFDELWSCWKFRTNVNSYWEFLWLHLFEMVFNVYTEKHRKDEEASIINLQWKIKTVQSTSDDLLPSLKSPCNIKLPFYHFSVLENHFVIRSVCSLLAYYVFFVKKNPNSRLIGWWCDQTDLAIIAILFLNIRWEYTLLLFPFLEHVFMTKEARLYHALRSSS